MIEVREQVVLDAGVEEAWELVGDFTGLLEALQIPFTAFGLTRTILGPPPVVERLEERDEATRTLRHSIIDGPERLIGYVGTMQVTDDGAGRARLDWTGRFEDESLVPIAQGM